MVKEKEQSSELFFVEVKEPEEVRKHILETLKDILQVLQKFEKFRQLRHKKIESIHKLSGLIKDANKMLGTLKGKLPQTNLRASAVKDTARQPKKAHHKKGKKKSVEEKQEKAPKKEVTELDKLESELNAIESKLKSLT